MNDERRPFGNDVSKIDRYRAFWDRSPVDRPLVGFSQIGWFPLEYFSVSRSWSVDDRVTPDMIAPAEWLDEQEQLLAEGEMIDDDMIRGVCPTQVAVPVFLSAALGCSVRVLPDTVIAEERKLSWDDAMRCRLAPDDPWLAKYLEFVDALVERADRRYPVSHSAELGPMDLHAVLRGHNESLIDLIDEPEKSAALLRRLANAFAEFTRAAWGRIPRYHAGYFDAQYQLWAPGPIARLQEDASAMLSPDLYRRVVQPVDRSLATAFANSFMHLHSTSMHLLDAFLEIDELQCFEINIEPFNVPVSGMLEYFRRVQSAGKSLLVRGSVAADELRLLLDNLDPCGLFLHLVVRDMREAELLRRAAAL